MPKSLPSRCSHTVQRDRHTSHWWQNRAQWWGGEQYGAQGGRKQWLSLGGLGRASQFNFSLLCEIYSVLLQVTTPVCAPLAFIVCIPWSDHAPHYCMHYSMPVSPPCTGKVSCFLCFWVSRVGSWWTLWWTSAQTSHATECWQTLIDRSLVNLRLWTLLLHSPSIWVLTETHICHIIAVGFGSEWWYLFYKVLGVGEGRIIRSRCSRTRLGNRKKDKSENELLILAETHLPLPQKCGCWPFPWGGLAEEQASGGWVDGL